MEVTSPYPGYLWTGARSCHQFPRPPRFTNDLFRSQQNIFQGYYFNLFSNLLDKLSFDFYLRIIYSEGLMTRMRAMFQDFLFYVADIYLIIVFTICKRCKRVFNYIRTFAYSFDISVLQFSLPLFEISTSNDFFWY